MLSWPQGPAKLFFRFLSKLAEHSAYVELYIYIHTLHYITSFIYRTSVSF